MKQSLQILFAHSWSVMPKAALLGAVMFLVPSCAVVAPPPSAYYYDPGYTYSYNDYPPYPYYYGNWSGPPVVVGVFGNGEHRRGGAHRGRRH